MAPKAEFRPDIPSTARMYDYYLGGKDNYPADRAAAEEVIASMPSGGNARIAAVENRKFLGRAVRYLAREAGIRQFLDIGSGLPTVNNVHEVAQSVAPDARVVYVDHDPVVLAHARDLLHGVPGTTILRHDVRDPEEILSDPEATALLDLSQPVGVLLISVLHFVTDAENPRGIIATLMDAVRPGSYLAIAHGAADSSPEIADAAEVYEEATSKLSVRSQAQVQAMFKGFDLVDPGVVWLPEWHPEPGTVPLADPSSSLGWCGVAVKS
jgi:SAM-dependent methyltransferase